MNAACMIRLAMVAGLVLGLGAVRADETDNPYGEANVFSRPRANKLHDRVTVSINLNDQASTNAKTDLQRDTETKWNIAKLFWNTTKKELPKPEVDMSSSRKHDADGTTETEASVKTEISGSVVMVLPNGHLVVEARRKVMINNEERIAVFAGRIAPSDLSESNVIDLKYVMDPIVQLIGKGDVSQLQKRGWLSKFSDAVNPF